MLLLVAPNERKVRIEVGYGLEGALTDALSKVIITTAIAPKFKTGDFAGGIEAGVDAILSILTGDAEEWQRRAEVRSDESAGDRSVVIVLMICRLRFHAVALDARPRRAAAPPPAAQRRLDRSAAAERGGWGGGWLGGGGGGVRRSAAADSRAVAARPAAAAPRGTGDADAVRTGSAIAEAVRAGRGEHGRRDRRRDRPRRRASYRSVPLLMALIGCAVRALAADLADGDERPAASSWSSSSRGAAARRAALVWAGRPFRRCPASIKRGRAHEAARCGSSRRAA